MKIESFEIFKTNTHHCQSLKYIIIMNTTMFYNKVSVTSGILILQHIRTYIHDVYTNNYCT